MPITNFGAAAGIAVIILAVAVLVLACRARAIAIESDLRPERVRVHVRAVMAPSGDPGRAPMLAGGARGEHLVPRADAAPGSAPVAAGTADGYPRPGDDPPHGSESASQTGRWGR